MNRPPAAAAPGRTLRDVRARCHEVAVEAALVRLDDDAVAPYADRLVREGVVGPAGADGGGAPGAGESRAPDPWDLGPVPDGEASPGAATDPYEARAALVLGLAAVNFGSGYHPHVEKRPGCSGATTTALAFRQWAAARPVTATRLAHVSPAEAHELFGQSPDDGPRAELMGLFAAALNDLGNLVLEEHGGSFLALVAEARGSAAGLVQLLDRLPFFHDVAPYRGRLVPFYKRAQLAAADLHRAFAGRPPADFTDLDELTAFADNLVPHVLRLDGVLRYDPDLEAAIDRGELLAAGSEAEVEIRAAGVDAVERLCRALADRGLPVRACDLDTRLWRRGGAPRYKAVPRHRSRTVYY